MKNSKALNDVKKKLAIIKNQDEIIREAFAIYEIAFPEYSADARALMIAEDAGVSRATAYNKKNGNQQNKKLLII